MQVCYFSNHFVIENGHGVARYSRELYQALREGQPDVQVVPVTTWCDQAFDRLQALRVQTGLQLLPWGRRWTPLAWTLFNYPPIEIWLSQKVDIVHSLALGFPVATRKPFLVTAHDIGPLTHPKLFSQTRPWLLQRSLKQAVRHASAIICVSRATATEIEAYIGQSLGERLIIIHEAVDAKFFAAPNANALSSIAGLPAPEIPFLLAVGKMSPRKNVARIIAALESLRDKIPHHLVLVGGDGWDTDEIFREIGRLDIADRVHTIGYVSDEQLRALYGAASAYVHPSLFEGFGLTILEAMASGCPVVSSNVYSLPEVAGDAAILVDPYDVKAIADGICAVCTDPSFAADLVAKGKTRAATFTWSRCADQVAGVYRTIG